MIPERLQTALIAQTAGVGHFPVAANDHKFSVSESDQRIHCAAGGLPVIGTDAGEVIKGQSGGIVGNQNAGNIDLTKILLEILAVAAEEKNAQRLLFPTQLDRPKHFVAVLIHVVNMKGIVCFVDQCLDGFDHFGEHFVGCSLDYDQNGVGMLLQLLCSGVDLETAFFYQTADLLPGLFADIGMVIQHSGYGGDTVAGFFSQIFDGHSHTSFK